MATVFNFHQVQHGNFITRYIANIAERKLPRRLKRLIYISSILGLIQQVKDPDMVLVEKLNDVFKIAKYPDAYILPMYIKSFIWKNINEGVIELTDHQIRLCDIDKCDIAPIDYNAIGIYFANNTPKWLKYGSKELMIRDVSVLINQIKTLKIA